MKAVVLVGGEGTRLRPLTYDLPKPLIPFVDRPFLDHLLDRLRAHGVEDVILSSPYLQEAFDVFMAKRQTGPRITWVTEESPLGTAGAVANAARGFQETFLVLNGDILTDLDLTALIEHHRGTDAVATITLTPVEDARPYGLVVLDQGRVVEFREKPRELVPGAVNAGTYVLEPEALEDVPRGRAVSIEREVFPALIAGGARLSGFVSPGYWIDVGTPEKYLAATFDALEGKVGGLSYEAPHVDPSAQVSVRSHLGRWVVLGPDSAIGEEAEIEDSVVLERARVGPSARIRDSIIGPGAAIGRGAIVQASVLAAGSFVGAGAELEGARVPREGNASASVR